MQHVCEEVRQIRTHVGVQAVKRLIEYQQLWLLQPLVCQQCFACFSTAQLAVAACQQRFETEKAEFCRQLFFDSTEQPGHCGTNVGTVHELAVVVLQFFFKETLLLLKRQQAYMLAIENEFT